MFNFAMSGDPEEGRRVKDLYKGVLATLIALLENGNGMTVPLTFVHLRGARQLRWTRHRVRGPACDLCACDTGLYESEDGEMGFRFCPACWTMKGEDAGRGTSFSVTETLHRQARDLPPGFRLKFSALKMEIPSGGSDRPMSEAEMAEAWKKYRREAEPNAEIGRQVWLGKIAFDGLAEQPVDYPEARRWFEKAARWGHGQSLWYLGLMAVHGLGEPVDH